MRKKVKGEYPELVDVVEAPTAFAGSKDYKCFNDYYKDRYQLHDLNIHQSLIECSSMKKVSILKRARNFLRKGWHVYRAVLEDMQEDWSESNGSHVSNKGILGISAASGSMLIKTMYS